MRRFSILPLLSFAILLACEGTPNNPNLSTDFNPGGLTQDVTGEPTDDATGPRDVPAETPADADAQDPGAEAMPADVPADAEIPLDVAPIDVAPTDVPPDDSVAPECEEGGIRGVPCGLNGNGVQPQACTGGRWVDSGPCDDPDACTNGDRHELPCGLNGRGTTVDECVNGQWTIGECLDPDACVDGDSTVVACGKKDAGRQARQCQQGQWVDVGECIQPGRWRCIDNVCTPSLGDASCGNGTCAPRSGESPSSCPADCGALPSIDGQGQPCQDAIDCAFYAWVANGPGYWECAGLFNRTCRAVVSGTYCDTDGWDYCYFDRSAIETDRSCPEDCVPEYLNCGSDLECIYQAWPTI